MQAVTGSECDFFFKMLLNWDVDVLSDFVFMEHDDIVEELVIQSEFVWSMHLLIFI